MSATTLPPAADPAASTLAATAPGSRVTLDAVVADL